MLTSITKATVVSYHSISGERYFEDFGIAERIHDCAGGGSGRN